MTSEPVFDRQIAAWWPAPKIRPRRPRRLSPAHWTAPGPLPLALLAWGLLLGLGYAGGAAAAWILALISDRITG